MDGDRTAAPRIHRIVDGDTLGLLAQRYLGNTQRQNEIYEANRDRLKDPELLPIGVELRIPSDSPPPPLRPVPTNPIRSPGV
jgi:nucleoid-associated protein YgaU